MRGRKNWNILLSKFCINNKIDINETSIENKNIIIDKGFVGQGYIIQLFVSLEIMTFFVLKKRIKKLL